MISLPRYPFYVGIEGGHCMGACRRRRFVYVKIWDGNDINAILQFTRDILLPLFNVES